MLGARRLIEGVALGQQVAIQPTMTLVRGDELQAAVVVFGVVPLLEAVGPGAGLFEVLEGLVGEARVGRY